MDNFARSIPTSSDNGTVGAVVDGGDHSRAMTGKSIDATLFDLRGQVQQFLDYDKARSQVSSQTVFTVFFGVWDLLEYSTLELECAMRAVDNTIAELFRQLDLLAKHELTPVDIILPRMIDVTYLPRFQSTANRTSEHFAEHQQKGVFLSAYWNSVLFRSASQWRNGEIYMPDPNAVIAEQVRARQLYPYGTTDASDAGKHMPLFEHVEQPCLILSSDSSTSDLQAAVVEKCSDTAAHLFWSVTHGTNALSHSNQVIGTN